MTTAPSPKLSREVHDFLGGLLARQFRQYRKRVRLCRRKFSKKAVHDLRVSIRRLLATVELVGGFLPARRAKRVRRVLKHELDAFGELRDLQVQLSQLAAPVPSDAVERQLRRVLCKRESACVRAARKAVKHWKPGRLAGGIAEFDDALRKRGKGRVGQRDFAALLHRTDEAFARVEALRALILPSDPGTIHRTRVAFKRFRYMVEALAPLLPTVSKSRLRALHAYQNRMGRIQDATVLLRSAEEFARKKLDRVTGERLLADIERRRHRFIRAYLKTAGRLLEFRLTQTATSAPAKPAKADCQTTRIV